MGGLIKTGGENQKRLLIFFMLNLFIALKFHQICTKIIKLRIIGQRRDFNTHLKA